MPEQLDALIAFGHIHQHTRDQGVIVIGVAARMFGSLRFGGAEDIAEKPGAADACALPVLGRQGTG